MSRKTRSHKTRSQKTRAYAAALLGATAPLMPFLGTADAFAAANPGQPVLNDYGQSANEVAAEIRAAVEATPAVAKARAAVTAAHATLVAAVRAEYKTHRAYVAAVHSKSKARIAAAKKADRAAHAKTLAARKAEAAAKNALSRILTSTTNAVRAQHYTPVDGTYTGAVSQYFIPGIGLEPIQVSITVYGGHVTDVQVPVYTSTGDSAAYNAMALPTLMQEAMAANDTANVATVTGASLTSGAFANSLLSALTSAGFKY